MQKAPRNASFLQATRAVMWSFLGVRKRTDYDADAQRLTLAQVIVAGLMGAGILVAALLGLVYLVTHLVAK